MPGLRWKATTIVALLAFTILGVGLAPRVLATRPTGIHKIRHVVIIMQENHSFDNYFGTFPGADGIPMHDGEPTVCVPDPLTHGCDKPFFDPRVSDLGGPHGHADALADIDGGKMDGFVRQQRSAIAQACRGFRRHVPAYCIIEEQPDVMGFHDARQIPNYWAYAHAFVLQDHLFDSVSSWTQPSHLYLVSGWSARCTRLGDPMSCHTDLVRPGVTIVPGHSGLEETLDYAWTDLTYLLYTHHVSWAYYVADGSQPDCDNDGVVCAPKPQSVHVPDGWNPLPEFDTVREDHQLDNIQQLADFYTAARTGKLPAVSWIAPNQALSEHPPSSIEVGQTYVTGLINAIMESPDWDSTAIFLAWDDWGGFYDNVVPPKIDANGYGLRVPGIVISPYAKEGYVDHQTLSFDAYLKFIEDDFIGGQRLDPKTDGRPDPRPDVRENAPQLGDLTADFDFTQPPRPPMLLPTHPKPGPASVPS